MENTSANRLTRLMVKPRNMAENTVTRMTMGITMHTTMAGRKPMVSSMMMVTPKVAR
jgi:hypothetical protein